MTHQTGHNAASHQFFPGVCICVCNNLLDKVKQEKQPENATAVSTVVLKTGIFR